MIKTLLRNDGRIIDSIADAEHTYGSLDPIVGTIKSAVDVLSTTNAAALAPPDSVIVDALADLRTVSAFDFALASMLPAPLGLSRALVVTNGVVAYRVGELGVKPISRMSLGSDDLASRKVVVELVLSAELLKVGVPIELYMRAQRAAVAAQTDAGLAEILTAGAPTIPSSGSTATAFLADLARALDAMGVNSASRIYLIGNPKTIASLALLSDGEGARAFPDLGIRTGSVADISVVATDGVEPPDTSGGRLILFNAAEIAANGGTLVPHVTHEATVQMDDAPDDPATATTTMISLWQHNLRGLRVERHFLAHKLRPAAAVVISGASYGAAA